ncbi:diaminopimelate epimerase [Sphingomonas spermidinifaciens]|uniref:Diaminopimelate epimerase n=2 Tax=Sphingomonas spermidinifaciens TaxID=1141889 RepID=A0A2A4B5C0_9SPHN|nr:diaminopimelate epimerase [Sphingomonas spermidinifaciens]PCD02836.1 diaminopimelate epimerase [Sphingomonas spermidinifaciens]
MQFDFIHCHGSGNDFPLIDARALMLTDGEWATVARLLADRGGPVGGDGLLLLVPGRGETAFGQRMFNPDGSEAETCLNGLRCVARAGFEATGLDRARVGLPKSDALAARVADIAPGVVSIETRITSIDDTPTGVGLTVGDAPFVEATIPGLPSNRRFTALAMPNPHLVTFVDAIDERELIELGDWCEAAPPLIPGRANVSFVTAGPAGLFVRTYERGVGLTDSCGSAMAASTVAAARTGRIGWGEAVVVRNRGGMVRARTERAADGYDAVAIAGNATFTAGGVAEIDLAAGRLISARITATRDAEIAAWDALIAGL